MNSDQRQDPAQSQSSGETQAQVIAFLRDPKSYQGLAGGSEIRERETHISHLFLTGNRAYKLKKAVRFEFLDFSTIERRKHFCEEELRLNARYSPDLYLGVLAICSESGTLRFAPPGTERGTVLDYVVEMNEFDESLLFDVLAAEGKLTDPLLEEAVQRIAEFHRHAAKAPEFGSTVEFRSTLGEVYDSILALYPASFPSPPGTRAGQSTDQDTISSGPELDLRAIRDAALAELHRCTELMERRRSTQVREVHGDLHLKNICVYSGSVHLFDGVEFNPLFSHGDLWNDFCFLLMDLWHRGLERQAILARNSYLEAGDDYEGLSLVKLFASYRAAVRAKVHLLQGMPEESRPYIELAARLLQQGDVPAGTGAGPVVFAVGGLSGSGKSTLAKALSSRIGTVHIRADVVRKQLFGSTLSEKLPQEAYAPEWNARTQEGMLTRASLAAAAGYSVLFDSVFHSPHSRLAVESFAKERKLPFRGFWCEVPPEVARARIERRSGDASDADTGVRAIQERYTIGELTWERLDTTGDAETVAGNIAF